MTHFLWWHHTLSWRLTCFASCVTCTLAPHLGPLTSKVATPQACTEQAGTVQGLAGARTQQGTSFPCLFHTSVCRELTGTGDSGSLGPKVCVWGEGLGPFQEVLLWETDPGDRHPELVKTLPW